MKNLCFARRRIGVVCAAVVAACSLGAALAQEKTLSQVVVTATRVAQPLTDVVADVTLIDRQGIERSGAASLVDVLARVPGIEMARNGGPGTNTSLYMRGADSRYTAVYVDGVRVDSQSTGGATWEAIPLAQIERIEVLRGPAAAIYGSDAMAGVIQVFTRKGEGRLTPYVSMGVGTYHTGRLDAGFSGAHDGWDYALGMVRETSEGFNARQGNNPDEDGYHNKSLSLRLGLQINPAHRLESTFMSNHADAQYDSSATRDDHSLRHMRTVGLNWLAQWSRDHSSRVTVSEGMDRYETTPTVYLTTTHVRSYLWHNEWRRGAHLFTAALERREDELQNASTTPRSTSRSQNAAAVGYGLKAGVHTLQANVRHDVDSEFADKTTGSLAYAQELAAGWRANASVGNGFRAPTLFHRFSTSGVASLQPEAALSREAGLRYTHAQGHMGLVYYRNKVSNLIWFDSSLTTAVCANGQTTPGGTNASRGCYASTARAMLEGLTLSGVHRLGAVNLTASMDVQHARDLDTGRDLARRARRHGVLGADTRVAGWQLGAEAQLSARRYDNAANTTVLGGYGVVNLHASTALSRETELLLRVDNLGNKIYQLANTYATPRRSLFVGLKWLPR